MVDESYQGTFSTGKVEVMGTTLKLINKKDGNFNFKLGDQVTLYLHPEDILEYEVKEQ